MFRACPLEIHWGPIPGVSQPDKDAFIAYCSMAEALGVRSVEIRGTLAEVLSLAQAAAGKTSFLAFRIRMGLSAFEEHTLAASTLLKNRLLIHIKPEDGESSSWTETLTRSGQQLQVEGDSADAAVVAIKHGEILWRRPDRPEQVYADALPVRHFGKQVGLIIEVKQSVEPFAAKGLSSFLIRGCTDTNELMEFTRSLSVA